MAYSRSIFPKTDIIIDIETIAIPPSEEDIKEALAEYSPPGNYKDPEKIAAHRANFEANAREVVADKNKFKINGKRMICCGLGVANGSEIINIEAFAEEDLSKIMDGVIGYLDKYGGNGFRIIGFNHEKFDWPELMKSGAMTKRFPKAKVSKWDSIDLMKKLFFGEKLDNVARAFGKKKNGSGSEVAGMYARGEWERIKEYCMNDVKITGEIYLACSKWQEL